MATTRKPRARATNPAQKLAIDDNAPIPQKRKAEPKEKPVTLAEVLAQQAAEDGKTVEEIKAELAAPAEEPKPERQPGTSNLAATIRSHRANYQIALHPNGKKTQNNGDLVATVLLVVPFEVLKAYGHSRFGRTYDNLNPGHQRMCIGNLIRGAIRKAEGADVMAWLEANAPKPEAEAAE